jgi:hypothetical protein
MKWLRSRRFLADAYVWKRERVGQLQAECQILETLLRATREDMAEVRSLEGEQLALAYGWMAPGEVEEAMREKREYQRTIESTWLAGEHNLKTKGQAA